MLLAPWLPVFVSTGDGAVWSGDKNGNGECDEEEIEWRNAGTIGGTATR